MKRVKKNCPLVVCKTFPQELFVLRRFLPLLDNPVLYLVPWTATTRTTWTTTDFLEAAAAASVTQKGLVPVT